MRIKMRTFAAGPSGAYHAGQEYDLPPAQASVLIQAGYATAVGAPGTAGLRETTAAPGAREKAAASGRPASRPPTPPKAATPAHGKGNGIVRNAPPKPEKPAAPETKPAPAGDPPIDPPHGD